MEESIEKKNKIEDNEEKGSKVEELKKKLEECQKLAKEYLVGWQRSRADFLNYKKGEAERASEIIQYANIELILKVLPILDNFELIEKKLPANLNNNEYIVGIFRIKNQLQDFFKNQGWEEIKTLGTKFNPNFHEVIEEVVTKDKESGVVIEEIQKGYLLGGKVIRPAKVKVVK